ncbi:caudovirales tail fiber assembly family protein [Yersinia rohdei]|uniref:Caudovirales tail fiber assembly family protein n=1 Tax=Yersinia rohdei TaxID=29485 RepID=A0ABN4F5K1_YERRO|nr:tail fiber assembly protein [Yersinia rohdei]AJJ11833.1 caudovirales tail fiber assembly family protein [Yersinia rohdei]EEQ00897.1 bacteriophage tail fiber assembly protein [Yersinia rohdei ATCC 43380]
MKVFYSAIDNSFYPDELREQYVTAGSWPDDAVEVSNKLFQEFITAPAGKERKADTDGMPRWVDVQPPSEIELIAQAEYKKTELMSQANSEIAPLQDAVDLNMANADEVTALQTWKKYRVLLNRVDIDAAPEIDWPVAPE